MLNTYGVGENNKIPSTYCEKMTGTSVHQVEHSKKSRDPSFEHLRFYGRNLPIKKHIPNTLVGVMVKCTKQQSIIRNHSTRIKKKKPT